VLQQSIHQSGLPTEICEEVNGITLLLLFTSGKVGEEGAE
jgi:hypothetical protein